MSYKQNKELQVYQWRLGREGGEGEGEGRERREREPFTITTVVIELA